MTAPEHAPAPALRDRASGSGPRLTVVSGPTAVGKGTVVTRLRAEHPELFVSVSATTRPPRPGEVDGVHYHFVADAEFDELIATDALLEWATVHGSHRYGTPRAPVRRRAGRRPGRDAGDRPAGSPAGPERMPGGPVGVPGPAVLGGTGAAAVRPRHRVGDSTGPPAAVGRSRAAAQAEFDEVIVNVDVGQAVADLVDCSVCSHGRVACPVGHRSTPAPDTACTLKPKVPTCLETSLPRASPTPRSTSCSPNPTPSTAGPVRRQARPADQRLLLPAGRGSAGPRRSAGGDRVQEKPLSIAMREINAGVLACIDENPRRDRRAGRRDADVRQPGLTAGPGLIRRADAP